MAQQRRDGKNPIIPNLDSVNGMREDADSPMKADLIEQIREKLKEQLDQLCSAAREAHAAATDPGSKAESKYDTRSLEASYLAVGQARHVEELAMALSHFENLRHVDFGPYQSVDAGALVELETAGGRAKYLLVPAAGGLEISEGADVITLLSPESPLYQNLLGCYVGDVLDVPAATVSDLR